MLYVLRHAKSSWKEPGQEDHERPLAPRGRKAAALLSRHLERAGIRPALVLCSSARRARETYEAVVPAGELVVERELYGASAPELLERLRAVPDSTASVMLIGHNPGLQYLVLCLAAPPLESASAAPELERLREKFPTCALAVLRFEPPWRRLGPQAAELIEVVWPSRLAAG
jgi:phosphohistidine phosphatase